MNNVMRLLRNRILLKSFAVFFCLEIIVSTVLPTLTMALTSGPTAPEATSFEPVDTTDMVNLSTGDLAYNIPLLEVPGPSGGYPLSLSYHAGIQPNEEASWVGLGWTLNSGAIVRNVNGFADDQFNQPNSSRFFWQGGNTETYSIGVSVGITGNTASVSAGLSFSQDTFQGSGVGMYAGVGVNYMIGESVGVGVGVRVGVSPYGDPYASAGVNLSAPIGGAEKSAEHLSAGIGVGVTVSSQGSEFYGSAGISASYKNGNNQRSSDLLGASISSGSRGISSNVSVAGASVSNNSQSSKLSTSSSGFNMPIPIWYGVSISLGYNYQRYWIDEIDKSTINGSLYYPENSPQINIDPPVGTPPPSSEFTTHYFDDKAFDTYSLLDPDLPGGIVDNPNVDKVLGGSFPNFDNYLVHAQGISGYMRPYYFQKQLYKRNNYGKNSDGNRVYETIQYQLSSSQAVSSRAEFRFINDFSNRFENDSNPIEYTRPLPMAFKPMYFSFTNNIKTGETGSNVYESNAIQGSSNINWFTNKEIISNSANVVASGFKETISSGFDRATPSDASDDDNIGGFTTINQSGVKYHFALPAYSYSEYMYSGNKTGTETFNEFYKGGKYAYTWYLTAITGPDYVDRGPAGVADGKLNDYDWGYWVEFEYGKWTDKYAWRNPSEGMNSDLDNDFQNFSTGFKEVYYLDAIRTKTHTAIFFKDIRYDAKSNLNLLRDTTRTYARSSTQTEENRLYENIKVLSDNRVGLFIPKIETCECKKSNTITTPNPNNPRPQFSTQVRYTDYGRGTYLAKPTSSLKLSSIVLIDNASLKTIPLTKLQGEYRQESYVTWQILSNVDNTKLKDQCDFSPKVIKYHLPENVYDKYDFLPALKTKALRVIELDTDETASPLSPETSNSFDFNLFRGVVPYGADQTDPSVYAKYGKLTLNRVSFLGKAGADLIPPLKFQYELDKPLTGKSDLVNLAGKYSFNVSNSGLIEGDLIKFTVAANSYYAVIMSLAGNVHNLKIVGKNLTPPAGTIDWRQTKNPPYNKDAYDSWGLYKSDYEQQVDDYASRLVSEVSAKSLDVWSLRSISTSTGAKIKLNYESDTYENPALAQSNLLKVSNITKKPGSSNYIIDLFVSIPNLDKILKLNDQLTYQFMFAHPYSEGIWNDCSVSPQVSLEFLNPLLHTGKLKVIDIKKVDGNWKIETDSDMSSYLRTTPDNYITDSKPVWNCLGSKRTFPCNIISPWIGFIGNCNFYEGRRYLGTYFVAGNISYSNESLNLGGGIRLSSIKVEGLTSDIETRYNYATDSKLTTGVTSYEPNGMDQFTFITPTDSQVQSIFNDINMVDEAIKVYKRELHKKFAKILSNAREVPAPGVLYETVKVEEFIISKGIETKVPNYTTYEFQTFKDGDVDIQYSQNNATDATFGQQQYENYINYSKKESRNVTIKDYTSRVGSLKKITLHDKDGNVISRTTNNYLHDAEVDKASYELQVADQFKGQGIIEETFTDARFVARKNTDFSLQGVISKREQFPVIQIGQTTTNYKSGITTSVINKKFDFYSGQVTQTISKDGYGNTYSTEIVPSYRIYPAMGIASLSKGNKNMLTQQASSYTYKVAPDNTDIKLGLASASVQTWSNQIPALEPMSAIPTTPNQPGIWRKHGNYSFVGDDNVALQSDGFYPTASVPLFNSWNKGDVVPTVWQKNSEITLYDVQSHALEATDMNNVYAATRMTPDQTRVTATAANSKFSDFSYSGAENLYANTTSLGNQLLLGSGAVIDVLKAHTGLKSVKTEFEGFVYDNEISANKTYRVSVWSTDRNVQIKWKEGLGTTTDITPSVIRQSGSWYLLESSFFTKTSRVKVWCQKSIPGPSGNVYFDDFRISPADASMNSYVYNQWGELSHILDDNNLFTEYLYDGMGRLKEVHKESFQYPKTKVVETVYHYANQE
jgi:hypothetical protein